MKILILESDTVVQTVEPKDNQFVFIVHGESVFYTDLTVSPPVMWKTTGEEIFAGRDKLGEGHRKVLKAALEI